MAVIKAEDVMGYIIGEQCVCWDCIDKSEKEEISQNDIITRDAVENGDELYFCDRCKKQIS
jgi:hypothetical protein